MESYFTEQEKKYIASLNEIWSRPNRRINLLLKRLKEDRQHVEWQIHAETKYNDWLDYELKLESTIDNLLNNQIGKWYKVKELLDKIAKT